MSRIGWKRHRGSLALAACLALLIPPGCIAEDDEEEEQDSAQGERQGDELGVSDDVEGLDGEQEREQEPQTQAMVRQLPLEELPFPPPPVLSGP